MYGFYVEEENKELIPSQILEIGDVEEITDILQSELIVVQPERETKRLWFFALTPEIIASYQMGMRYGIVDLTPEMWKETFYV